MNNKWLSFIQKYLFFYKDGFFEFPYLSNSPQLMINSFIENPSTTNNCEKQEVASNNPFINGNVKYVELEKGFWILAFDVLIKENVVAKAVYDNLKTSDYFFLTYSAFEYEYTVNDVNQKNTYLMSKGWTLYKPNTEVNIYFYKNTAGKFINILFNKDWANKNIFSFNGINNLNFQNFLQNQKTGFYVWLDVIPNIQENFENIFDSLKNLTENKAGIKNNVMILLSNFFTKNETLNRITDLNKILLNSDYVSVAKAERVILMNLHLPFVGIEFIAKETNISATKLKVLFKIVFGYTMLQYHIEKKLQLAKQLLMFPEIQIKTIASMAGYENASKFSASFKKRFGYLPSHLKR